MHTLVLLKAAAFILEFQGFWLPIWNESKQKKFIQRQETTQTLTGQTLKVIERSYWNVSVLLLTSFW